MVDTRDVTRQSRGQVRIREEKGRKKDTVRDVIKKGASHALYVYFPLFIPAGLLGQFGEPLLEVVAAGTDIPGFAFVVLGKRMSIALQ